jgi:hypothetical protein
MLGWTTNLVGLLVLVLMVPIGYSMFSMFLSGQAIGLGEPEFELGEEGLSLSLPFYINNTGRFPISDVAFTTDISDYRGTQISGNQVVIPLVPEGSVSWAALDLVLGIDSILSDELSHLLFQDSELSVDISARFTYAQLVTFEIQLSNQTFPWGAPLHNLSFGKPTSPMDFNETHYRVYLPISFESHLPLSLGAVRIEFLNDMRQSVSKILLGEGLPTGGYTELEVFIERSDLPTLTESGFIHVYFKISGITYGPVEVPYG